MSPRLYSRMRIEELERKLVSAARKHPPSQEVPPFFARRVLAHVASSARNSVHWSLQLWRAALPCVLLAIGAATWAHWNSPEEENDWNEAFERAVLVSAIEQDGENALMP